MSVQIQVGITQRIYTTMQLQIGITQDIYWPSAIVRRWIRQAIYDTVQLQVGITQGITIPTVQLQFGITQRIYTVAQIQIGITQQIYTLADSSLWRSRVMLDGVDYSARLIGTIKAERNKSASSVAEFSILPSSGPFNPLAWVGQTVTIDDVLENASGAQIYVRRIYTGRVEKPTHNVDAGTVDFICSTILQARQDALSNEQITEQIPGSYWSEHVFKADSTGWNYTEERLSTVQLAMWVDRFGVTQVTTSETATTPDITITDASRLADSVYIQRAEKNTIINRVHVDLDFRFDRFKQRNISVNWKLGVSLCELLKNQFPLPTRDMIRSAAGGSSWDQQGSVSFTDAWPPQIVDCGRSDSGARDIRVWGWSGVDNGTHYTDGLSPVGGYDYAGIAQLCIGASISLGKRWVQTVTETYALDITSPLSIEANGERALRKGYGIEAESDAAAFEADKSYGKAITASGNTIPGGVIGGSLSAMPEGATVLPNGDYLYESTESERDGRTALANAIETALHYGDTIIKNSHRQNMMGCVIPMQLGMELGIDLNHSLRIETVDDAGEGRVVRISHERNIATGSALDTIEIAILQVGAVGLDTPTPLDPPDAPEVDPNTEVDQTGGLSTGYKSTHIGGSVSSEPYDPSWAGYVTNYIYDNDDDTPLATDPNDPQAVYYPEGFYINTPEIGDADRQAIEAPVDQNYIVELIADTLTEAAA